MVTSIETSVNRVQSLYDKYVDVNARRPKLTRLETIRLQKRASALEKGHQIFRKIYALLDKVTRNDFVFFKEQRQFIQAILGGIAPRAFGPAYKNNEAEIRRVNRLESLIPYIIFEIYRRGGKTTVAMIMVAILLQTIPNYKIIAIAPRKRQSGGDMGLIGVLKQTFDRFFPDIKYEANQEKLVVHFGKNDVRYFGSYSAAAGDG